MSTFYMMKSDSLSHHGAKGMKWGARRQRASVGGTVRRALAGVYGMNERFWRKTGNKAAASMQAYAKTSMLKAADKADAAKAAKRQAKIGQKAIKKMNLADKKLNSLVSKYDKLEKKGYVPGDRKWDKLDAKYNKYSNAYWDSYAKSQGL